MGNCCIKDESVSHLLSINLPNLLENAHPIRGRSKTKQVNHKYRGILPQVLFSKK